MKESIHYWALKILASRACRQNRQYWICIYYEKGVTEAMQNT